MDAPASRPAASPAALEVRAGCRICQTKWTGKNAQAVAARHYDATRHETWVEVNMQVTYGGLKRTPQGTLWPT